MSVSGYNVVWSLIPLRFGQCMVPPLSLQDMDLPHALLKPEELPALARDLAAWTGYRQAVGRTLLSPQERRQRSLRSGDGSGCGHAAGDTANDTVAAADGKEAEEEDDSEEERAMDGAARGGPKSEAD